MTRGLWLVALAACAAPAQTAPVNWKDYTPAAVKVQTGEFSREQPRTGYVLRLSGNVFKREAGSSDWTPAQLMDELLPSTELKVDPGASAVFQHRGTGEAYRILQPGVYSVHSDGVRTGARVIRLNDGTLLAHETIETLNPIRSIDFVARRSPQHRPVFLLYPIGRVRDETVTARWRCAAPKVDIKIDGVDLGKGPGAWVAAVGNSFKLPAMRPGTPFTLTVRMGKDQDSKVFSVCPAEEREQAARALGDLKDDPIRAIAWLREKDFLAEAAARMDELASTDLARLFLAESMYSKLGVAGRALELRDEIAAGLSERLDRVKALTDRGELAQAQDLLAQLAEPIETLQSIEKDQDRAKILRARVERFTGIAQDVTGAAYFHQAVVCYRQAAILLRSSGQDPAAREELAKTLFTWGASLVQHAARLRAQVTRENFAPTLEQVQRELNEADKLLAEAFDQISEKERVDVQMTQGLVQLNRGDVAAMLGAADQARPCYERADALFQQVEKQEPRADVRAACANGRGRLAERANDLEAARKHYERAVEILRKAGMLPDLVSAMLNLGAVLPKAQALQVYRDALAVLEEIRTNIGLEKLGLQRAAFLRDRGLVYERLVATALELGDIEKAFEFAEASKSRTLQDLLALHRRSGPPLIKPAEWLQPRDFTVDGAKHTSRAVILEYFVTSDAVLVFWVTRERIKAQRIPIGSRDLEAKVLAVRSAIQHKCAFWSTTIQQDLKELQEKLQALAKLLLGPVSAELEALGPDDVLAIVPHGILHILPFQALTLDGSMYLFEKHAICYAPSASMLAQFAAARRPMEGALFVAKTKFQAEYRELPDLPNTAAEARSIAKLFAVSKILSDDSQDLPTEKNLRAALSERAYGLVQFCTHGCIAMKYPAFRPSEDPLDAFLVLQEGVLTAEQIASLNFQGALVVASACYSGDLRFYSDGYSAGDEFTGIAHAFLAGGASGVLGGQFYLRDTVAPRVTEEFVRLSLAGWPRALALQKSMQKIIARWRVDKQEEYQLPITWVPYVLLGDGR